MVKRDITKCILAQIRSLHDSRLIGGELVGREFVVDHDGLLDAEMGVDTNGISFKMVNSNTSLIINEINKVEYDFDSESELVYTSIYNENYRYLFVEEEIYD